MSQLDIKNYQTVELQQAMEDEGGQEEQREQKRRLEEYERQVENFQREKDELIREISEYYYQKAMQYNEQTV